MEEEKDERVNDNSILGDGDRTSEASSADSGAIIRDETDSERTDGEETINGTEALEDGEGEESVQILQGQAIRALPKGCNVFYGTYIDNYNGSTRTRYYLDSYGQLIPSVVTTSNSRPTGSQCMKEMPMSHNMDMGVVVAEAAAAIAIYLAVKFVVGRLIK